MNPDVPRDDDPSFQSSFDETMKRLRDGDQEASRTVFNRYAHRLVAMARKRLEPRIQQKEDPEDVVQSVFRSFFARYGAGTLSVEDWESLWSMLALLTARKCGRRARHYHTGRRDISREAPSAATESQAGAPYSEPGDAPTPDEEAVLHDTIEQLLAEFDQPKHKQIIRLTLEGLNAEQVSNTVPCTERMVHRVLVRVREWLVQHGQDQAE